MDEKIAASIMDDVRRSASFARKGALSFGFDGKSVPLSPAGFRPVSCAADPSSSVFFVDGGSAEILSSPSLCVSFIRVYHTGYRANARFTSGFDELYAVVSATPKDDSLVYSVALHPVKRCLLDDSFFGASLAFDSSDPLLSDGSQVSVSAVAGMVRRIAELSASRALLSRLFSGDSLVLDGDLGFRTGYEQRILAGLKSVSEKKNVVVSALSKTSSLLASDGSPLSFVLSELAPKGIWQYPVSDEVSFVRLHPSSDYIFRLDSFAQHDRLTTLLSLLVRNSSDAVFLGYPYGLVDADRFARVSNHDAECLKAMFFARAGKDAELLRRLSRSSDAHSVLDNIL